MQYPFLVQAVVYMQLDNGWHDPAGAQATVDKTVAWLRSDVMDTAEGWCAAAASVQGTSPHVANDLELACTGSDISPPDWHDAATIDDGDGYTVEVPKVVHEVLNELFDRL